MNGFAYRDDNDKLKYKSISGDIWDAVQVDVGPAGLLVIDVQIPGSRTPHRMQRVRLMEKPDGEATSK